MKRLSPSLLVLAAAAPLLFTACGRPEAQPAAAATATPGEERLADGTVVIPADSPKLKEIHGEAYGWAPPDVAGIERLPSNRMRQYVRAWINEWDLRRLDPAYHPEIEAPGLAVDLSTDTDLEGRDEDR